MEAMLEVGGVVVKTQPDEVIKLHRALPEASKSLEDHALHPCLTKTRDHHAYLDFS